MEWFDLKNYPEYEITKCGLIRHKFSKRIKSIYIGSTGYRMVSINKNGKSKPARVHRLLAKTFIDNKDNKFFINHKNGIKTDNSLDNLEWCTHKENMQHAFSTKLANNTGEKNGQSKLTEIEVLEIKKLLNEKMLSQEKIAKIYKVSRSCILGINTKRLWNHLKY